MEYGVKQLNKKNITNMLGIKLIIAILFVIIALLSIFFVIIRAIKNNKNWKIIEPELIKKVQESTRQEIIHTMTLNASELTSPTARVSYYG